MARASAGFEPAGMLRARTFPVSISSSRGGRCRRIRRDSVGGRPSAFSSSLPPSSPDSRGFCAPPSSSFTGGAFGQKMGATSAMSNRDRKLEIPSTHEVRNFGSSFIQSCSYQVLTLSGSLSD